MKNLASLCVITDADHYEANRIDLAIRSNKWEGEDEEEEVKVRIFHII